MSHDQRPARIRVVGNGARTEAPQRRRGDASAAAGVAAPDAATPPELAKPRLALLPAALFLIACALGGIALPLLGLVR